MTATHDATTRRTEEAIPLEQAAAHRLQLVGDTSTWTEAQWREHDERVRAQTDRRDALVRESEQKARRERYAIAGFPARALDAAVRADLARPIVKAIAAWDPRQDGRCVLVLAGPVGCGKTIAAAWWAMRQSFVPAFLRASTFAANSRYDAKARAQLYSAQGLVIDDLGAEYLDEKGSFLVDVDELVDTFYGDRRPLIMTTNLRRDVFQARYGARIVDRLRECGRWWEFKETSMRPTRRA